MERKADADLGQPTPPPPGAPGGSPGGSAAAPGRGRPGWTDRRSLQAVVLAALAAAGLGGLACLQQTAPPDGLAEPMAPPLLFPGWDRPEVVLLISGQMHGYTQPCGCSRPQYGGLARRYNFIHGLKEKGWPVVSVDLGDLAQRTGPYRQKMDKYKTSMEALQRTGYTAVGLGQNEMALGTLEALSHFSLNSHTPRVLAANLQQRGQNELFLDMVGAWAAEDRSGGPRVAVLGLIGPSVADKVHDADVKLTPKTSAVMREVLGELKQQNLKKKAALTALLYQGSLDEAKECARFCAELRKTDPTLPKLDVIACLTVEDLAPSDTVHVGDSIIVRVGHKGKSVGVVGLVRKGGGQELRYQMVELGPQYETPVGQETSNPVMVLMEEYARRVKDNKYMADYRQVAHPVQVAYPNSTYVGSDKCMKCHKDEYKIWKGSAHSHAFTSLAQTKRPSLRQYDGECISCHVVGFGYTGGFTDELKTAHLKDVGCESCHGPGSEHIKNTQDEGIHAALNPWKAKPGENAPAHKQRMLRIDGFCQKCHDVDNDVHWDFDKNWPKIDHSAPQPVQANPAPQLQPVPNAPVPLPPAVQPAPQLQPVPNVQTEPVVPVIPPGTQPYPGTFQATPNGVQQQPNQDNQPTSSGRRFFSRFRDR